MSLEHQLTKNVKLLQKVAILRQQEGVWQALLLKRSNQAHSRPGAWDLPGGNSEWPSNDQQSVANLHRLDVAREVKEETDLEITPEAFTLPQLSHFSTYFDHDKGIYTMICGWMIDFTQTNQADIKISDEHQSYQWVTAAELDNYDFAGDKGAFVLNTIQQAFAKMS